MKKHLCRWTLQEETEIEKMDYDVVSQKQGVYGKFMKKMTEETGKGIRWSMIYLTGAMLQMLFACAIKFFLEKMDISYPAVCNLIFLIIGGMSTAIWGIIISKKSGRVDKYLDILKDYFKLKQPIKFYGVVILFLLILFGVQMFTGKTEDGVVWYTFPILFAQALIFGGIEEIGWRYTFQPLLETRISYEIASVIIFISWGTWHYMYFYITDTISAIQHETFLIGLLGSCFIIGAIQKIGKSLWLCVLYHCLLNTFSQTLVANDLVVTIICNAIGICLAIFIVRKFNNKEKE